MEATLTGGAVAVVLGALGFVMHKKRVAPRWTTSFFLLAGLGITGGIVGQGLTNLAAMVGRLVGTGTAKAFGVGVPLAAVAVVIALVAIDWKKNGARSKSTPWLALAIPALLAATAGVYIGVGGEALSAIGNGFGDISTFIFTMGG